jgi:hypothetical protein
MSMVHLTKLYPIRLSHCHFMDIPFGQCAHFDQVSLLKSHDFLVVVYHVMTCAYFVMQNHIMMQNHFVMH